MPNCRTIDNGDGRQRCEVCGNVFPAGLKLPIRAQCGQVIGDGPAIVVRVNIKPSTDEPAPMTFVDLPCAHRGEVVAQVPCGLCGQRGAMKEVAVCGVYGRCTAGNVGRTSKQRIDGKVPAVCLGCRERKAG